MREIKFRAWNKKTYQMFSPEEMGEDELTINPDGKGFVNVSGTNTKLSQYYPHMIPLQYTGLKDKNGTDIYEGDIVRFTYHVRSIDFVVIFHNGAFVQEHCDKLDQADYEETKTVWYEWDEVEIVSNIYENKELCEVD